jgi:aspartokinase/homoserine dehydrogenase 1
MSLNVLKFGGSSLANSERLDIVARIICERISSGGVVVCSAMAGATDALITAATVAAAGHDPAAHRDGPTAGDQVREHVQGLRERHVEAVRGLCAPRTQSVVLTKLQLLLGELEDVLRGVSLLRECSPRTLDLVMSFGERLLTVLLTHMLTERGAPAQLVEARDLIRTDARHGSASVQFAATYERVREALAGSAQGTLYVVPGFVAATAEGVTTTLGRDGSDYTASLIAAALGAAELEIWTDVDGVMSADPRQVDDAFVVAQLSYQEAMEMSYFGARVIHPYTMVPAVECNIPIRIRNTLRPDAPGTLITREPNRSQRPITGIASIDSIALINVEGGGMLGAPGMAARVLGALARGAVNIMMISQASSEHSICLVLRASEAEDALSALRVELALELETKRIDTFDLRRELVILAIIGENMRGTPGIAGKLFAALGGHDINVLAIAQGSSERNISLVIDAHDESKALRVIHSAFLNS